MARLTWIIFAICVLSCSAQFGIGRRPERRTSKPITRAANNLLRSFGVNPDDHKCFTLARRPFFMSRLVHYPCSRRQPGVPVIRWFMTKCKRHNRPMGPMCVSYVREPVYRYFRIPMCCPGYTSDQNGKCSIKTQRFAETSRRNNEDIMRMASNMRQAMYMRAKNDMQNRMRAHMDFRRNQVMDRSRNVMMPQMERRPTPPMPQIPQMPRMPQMMMNNLRRPSFSTPRVSFLRFNTPMPPMPHPLQRPPVTGRMIKIIKRKFIPLYPFMAKNMFNPRKDMQSNREDTSTPPVPRVVLSGRSDNSPMARMKELRPPMPSFFKFSAQRPQQSLPRFDASPMFSSGDQQPQNDHHHDHSGHNHDHSHDGFSEVPSQEISANIRVDLPGEPVQMPDIVVEQAPSSQVDQQSCISVLEAAVKSCLKQSNIDIPDVMSAFEPFNDDKSRLLCEAEDTIFNCISTAFKECQQSPDGDMARDMLLETAQTVQSMCDLRQANVAQSSPGQVTGGDTMATVENVDDIPTDVKPSSDSVNKDEITIIEDSVPSNTPSVESVQEAIQHEVHVQEMRMKEYLLPILVGSGVGFMVLVLLLSLFICCCCKRRFRKKMRMAKEMEKPPLKDGIYTIGIPPPKYEVNGIPPMYYEEAKGEKITSRSPAVLEGAEDGEDAEKTQM
ncbi:hypothetical protein ACF0H5_008557 [Mactra antiquata]